MEFIEEIKKKILSSFGDIEFIEESHQYFKDGKELLPVSTVTHHFKPEFNADLIAGFVARKEGRTKEEVLKEWSDNSERACTFGTSVHDFAERLFDDRTLIPRNIQEEAAVQFWNDLPSYYIPVLCETRVYDVKYGYAGTFDLLLYNTMLGGLSIMDYKTNQDLWKNHKEQKMLKPFDYMLDRPHSVYTLQLSAYQIPLENIGLPVVERILIWFKPEGGYEMYATEDVTKTLREHL